MDKARTEILSKMPEQFFNSLSKCSFVNLEEIRFRIQRPVMLYYSDKVLYLSKNGATSIKENLLFVSPEDISYLMNAFCKSSVYAYQQEINEGFITIDGGHRIGIAGRAVTENGKLRNIEFISSLNIRIAREVKGSADCCLKYMTNERRIYNTVIISPPGVGKTTVLRDCARQLSQNFKVSVVDERSELAASMKGVPQFDIGEQTDVLDSFSKSAGIIRALRSLSPDVIITDEIGAEDDIFAISEILKGGCKIITSMHGYSLSSVMSKKRELMELFEVAVLLKREENKVVADECIRLWE